jgi:ubiquinone/menaquinone biosynthesis C-methylase UbiE
MRSCRLVKGGPAVVGKVDYDDRQFAVYAQGRALSPAMLARWMKVFEGHAPPQRPLAVLDLGSGTGRFTPALAATFGGPVYGVEPSWRMRDIAIRSAVHPAVSYLAGCAEDLPLPAGSCDVVLVFLVYHHVTDPAAGAAEISRVLRPGGRVLIRSTFADRMPGLWWHQFFPRAVEIEKQMFPAVGEVEAAFARTGLHILGLETVRECFTGNLAESAARLRLRAISTFEHLTEQETTDGFAALDAAVHAGTQLQPIDSASDLLVLG